MGFNDEAIYYNQEATKLDRDSILYYSRLASTEFRMDNLMGSSNYRLKIYAMDSSNTLNIRYLGSNYSHQGNFEESLKYYEKYISIKKARGEQIARPAYYRIGFAYLQNGYEEEAEFYLNEHIDICNKAIELGGYDSKTLPIYFELACVYAIKENVGKAIENLRIINQHQKIPVYVIRLLKIDHVFDKIRDEPEFQQIVSDLEAKYQAEHERVRQWLEENDMI